MAFGRKRADKRDGWQSGADSTRPARGLSALRDSLKESGAGVLSPAKAVLSDSSDSAPAKILTLAEMLADTSSTPIGRIVTATLALVAAYLLI